MQVNLLRFVLARGGAGRHRGQVPGPGGGSGHRLNGDLWRGRHAARRGLPAVAQPLQRRDQPRPLPGCTRRLTGAPRSRREERGRDAAGKPVLLGCGLCGIRGAGLSEAGSGLTFPEWRSIRRKCALSLIAPGNEFAAVVMRATGTPFLSVAIWYLVPRMPRSVGFCGKHDADTGSTPSAMNPGLLCNPRILLSVGAQGCRTLDPLIKRDSARGPDKDCSFWPHSSQRLW